MRKGLTASLGWSRPALECLLMVLFPWPQQSEDKMWNVVSILLYLPLVCAAGAVSGGAGLRLTWLERFKRQVESWGRPHGGPGTTHTCSVAVLQVVAEGWLPGPRMNAEIIPPVFPPAFPSIKLSKQTVRLKPVCGLWAWLSSWTSNNHWDTVKANSKLLLSSYYIIQIITFVFISDMLQNSVIHK